MKHDFYMLAFLFVVNVSFAQNVEILGDLKLVNGTQGAGKFLMSDAAGNSNWLTSDRILIESLKLKKGGIQRLLDWGIDPLTMWQNGVRADSIYGKIINPGGGLQVNLYPAFVYFIDTLDINPSWKWLAAVQYPSPYTGSGSWVWGCSGTAIPGAQGENFLDGIQNTTDRLAGCTATNTAFSFGSGIAPTGFSMASKADAAMIIQNAVITGTWNLTFPTTPHWTSTEGTGVDEATKVWAISNTGVLTLQNKTATSVGLAFKGFSTMQ